MRRLVPLLFTFALLVVLVPTAGATTTGSLDISVTKAPITPDGLAAGAITDFILTFVDLDPAVDGIGLHAGGTVTATLPEDFVNLDDGTVNAGIILQGWPQSPPAPPPAFIWTTTVSGNSITATLDADYLVGAFGPGPKQFHLLLNSFRNPGPGLYDVDLVISPTPTPPTSTPAPARCTSRPSPSRAPTSSASSAALRAFRRRSTTRCSRR